MIQVTVNFSSLELKIIHTTDEDEFNNDLDWIKDHIDQADREYRPDKKLFVVSNIQKYMHLERIRKALELRRQQPTLF